jgi:hypothetical protein
MQLCNAPMIFHRQGCHTHTTHRNMTESVPALQPCWQSLRQKTHGCREKSTSQLRTGGQVGGPLVPPQGAEDITVPRGRRGGGRGESKKTERRWLSGSETRAIKAWQRTRTSSLPLGLFSRIRIQPRSCLQVQKAVHTSTHKTRLQAALEMCTGTS